MGGPWRFKPNMAIEALHSRLIPALDMIDAWPAGRPYS